MAQNFNIHLLVRKLNFRISWFLHYLSVSCFLMQQRALPQRTAPAYAFSCYNKRWRLIWQKRGLDSF